MEIHNNCNKHKLILTHAGSQEKLLSLRVLLDENWKQQQKC